MDQDKEKSQLEAPKESFLKVIVHSFFVIPFLIAVFCVLLFAGMHLLTSEKRSAYDYLKDIKVGSESKRWQAAFELSKMLANAKALPEDPNFYQEMLSTFEHTKNDNNPLVRQYLALAMGRSGKSMFVTPLVKALKDGQEAQTATIIYSLGMLKAPETADAIAEYLNSSDARIRSIATTALGNIANPVSKPALRQMLNDSEPNVQWGAAVSLAQMGDVSGKEILLKILDRSYLSKFPEVDAEEQTQLMAAAIDAGKTIRDADIINRIKELSQTDTSMRIRAKCLEVINR